MTKATGGGAYKFADLFKERLGLSLDKEDEMGCLVAGANFLLKVDPIFGIICFSCILFKNHLDSNKPCIFRVDMYVQVYISCIISLPLHDSHHKDMNN